MSSLPVSQNTSSSQEDSVRASLALLSLLEVEAMDYHSQGRALTTLQRGVGKLLADNPGAAGLHHFAKTISSALAWTRDNQPQARTGVQTPTARAALTQPNPSLPSTAHHILLSCWGLVTFTCWRRRISIPVELSGGWRKLADAKLPAWRSLSVLPIDTPRGIDAAIEVASTSITKEFLQSLRTLSTEVSFGSPSIGDAWPEPPRLTSRPSDSAKHTPTTAQPIQADEDNPIKPERQWAPSALDENFKNVDGHFISWQLVQASYLPAIDGYGLPTRWEALHPNELLRCCTRLGIILTSNDPKARLTAAVCLTALVVGLPPQLVMQVRLTEYGDTWIDLPGQTVKRDLCAIAPRKDRAAGGGNASNWRSVPMIPAAATELARANALTESAESVGDLCVSRGISLIDIHTLLNDSDDTSHRPETSRFARSLGLFLRHVGIQPVLAAQASGDWSLCPTNDHYYLLADDNLFVGFIGVFCRAINVASPGRLTASHFTGSPHCPTSDEVSALLHNIASELSSRRARLPNRSRIADYIEFQNEYQLACAFLFVCLTGHRGTRLSEARWQDIDLVNAQAMICDKQSDEYSARRLVPLVEVLVQTLTHLWAHHLAVADHFQKLLASGNLALNADALNNAQQHLFYQVKRNRRTRRYYVSAINHEDLSAFLKPYTARAVNLGRHFGFTGLVLADAAHVAINAWSGRHSAGSEPFGLLGRLSSADVCRYLQPELEKLFEPMNLTPLIGFGSTRKRDVKLPGPRPLYSIKPPLNDCLHARLKAEDLLPTEIKHTQRCPFMADTLEASRYIDGLRQALLKSDLLSIDRGTAVLFCLIVFDAVVNESELAKLYQAVVGHPQRVRQACFAEAKSSNVVIASRQISPVTVGCLGRLFEHGDRVERTWSSDSAHALLTTLDPAFLHAECPKPMTWLMTLVSHWLLLHVAPTEQFPVFAGARSVSVEDFARAVFEIPGPDNYLPIPPRPSRKSRGLTALTAYVRYFANKCLRLGEKQHRRSSLARVVDALRATIDHHDDGLRWACEWVLAECRDPPSNMIKVGTVHAYLLILTPVFEHPLPLSEFDAENWSEIRSALIARRRTDTLGDVEGALMHLARFMRSRGLEVPAHFLRGHRELGPVPLRQPILVFSHEIARAEHLVAQTGAPWRLLATAKMRFIWDTGARPIEATNLAARDVSADGGLVHIQPVGFDHLKTRNSGGTVTVSNPGLHQVLLETAAHQRTMTKRGDIPLLFRRETLGDTVAMDCAILHALREATGKTTLTLRDLRATAITNSVTPIEELIRRLATPDSSPPPRLSTTGVNQRSISMALAVRRARHSISFPTTQRRYDVGSALRLREALRMEEWNLEVGSAFIGAIAGKTRGAIEVAQHRSRALLGVAENSWGTLAAVLRQHMCRFAEPGLRDATSVGEKHRREDGVETIGWAVMLWRYGFTAKSIEHSIGVPEATLNRSLVDLESSLGFPVDRDCRPLMAAGSPIMLSSTAARKYWIGLLSSRQALAARGRAYFAFRSPRGALTVPSQDAARTAAELLTPCLPADWQITVVAPPGYELERREALRESLSILDVNFETRRSPREKDWAIRVGPRRGHRHTPRTIGEINTFSLRGVQTISFLASAGASKE